MIFLIHYLFFCLLIGCKLLSVRFFEAGGGDLCGVRGEAWRQARGGCGVHGQQGHGFHAKQAGDRDGVVATGDGGEGGGAFES